MNIRYMDDYVVRNDCQLLHYYLSYECISKARFRLCKGSVKRDKCRSSQVQIDSS